MMKYWRKSQIIKNSLFSNLAVIFLIVLGATPEGIKFLWLSPSDVALLKTGVQLFFPVIIAWLNSSTILERMNPTIKALWSEPYLPGSNRPRI